MIWNLFLTTPAPFIFIFHMCFPHQISCSSNPFLVPTSQKIWIDTAAHQKKKRWGGGVGEKQQLKWYHLRIRSFHWMSMRCRYLVPSARSYLFLKVLILVNKSLWHLLYARHCSKYFTYTELFGVYISPMINYCFHSADENNEAQQDYVNLSSAKELLSGRAGIYCHCTVASSVRSSLLCWDCSI